MMFQVLLAVVFMLGFAGSQGIDPSEIAMSKREYWCNMQTASCPLICHSIHGGSKTPDSNACDPETLSYSCVCASGQPPNATKYTQTIPYYICMQKNRECVKNCNGVQSCQSACRTQNPCGAQHPERVNITTRVTTTAASTSPPTGVVYTGFGGTATADPKKDGGSSVTSPIDIGRVYGLFVVMGGILAGFGVLL